MKIDRATPLLAGLTPLQFMRRHWQKKPLLVRAALPDALPALSPGHLFALAGRDDVESRLVVRSAGDRWHVRPGPLPRRALPPPRQPGWTLLVQGVDLHDDAAHRLLRRFRFIADARLDDVMVSYASDGGGVGPHVDSYDVFLLQLAGRRRWRVGRSRRAVLRDDVPLKMLAAFTPTEEWLLEAGDMLYLPPGWGHDGVAVGPCLTASIGFRAPSSSELAAALAERLADAASDDDDAPAPAAARARFRDAGAAPSRAPARIPPALQSFAAEATARLLGDAAAQARALGEVLSEPKPGTWFERAEGSDGNDGDSNAIEPDRRTRMLYDSTHIFVNGEAFVATGADVPLLRRLADQRGLDGAGRRRLSASARELVRAWLAAGWLRERASLGHNGEP